VKHLRAESPHIFCNVAQLHGVEVKTKGLKLLGGHFMIRGKWRLWLAMQSIQFEYWHWDFKSFCI
jgi:hypothetical protein